MKHNPRAGRTLLASNHVAVPAQPGPAAFPGLTSADRAPREEILHLAYARWESEGHPENRQLENWLEAEAEVMSRT